MQAAVIFEKGGLPQFTTELPEPSPGSESELLISVKAAAMKHLDKSRASGNHYTTKDNIEKARVPGGDGAGTLADGTRVFAMGVTGMMAEKAIIDKSRMVLLPDGINYATAAALPNAIAGSAMALRFRAEMKKGETVLINGATGFTGRIAVQVARHYGAGRIIVTGRNEQSLQQLLSLGADEMISTRQDSTAFVAQIQDVHQKTPIDVVIDYLWGTTAELILAALHGKGNFTHRTRFVSIGSMTGDKIQFSAETLRSVDLQLSGSGLGSWKKEEMQRLFQEIIPEMLQLAADDKLQVDTEGVRLSDIERIWDMEVPNGKRLVVLI